MDQRNYRECWSCHETKPVEQFYRDGTDKDGNPKYRRRCKECDIKKRSLPIEKAKREKARALRSQKKRLADASAMHQASKVIKKKKSPVTKALDKRLAKINKGLKK